jgi:hypothetical protein
MVAIVYNKRVTGPSTHAIVIGVGHYQHLPGGGKKRFPDPSGMGQLKSPPASARALARWLIEEYKHPKKPLASLSLLLSDSQGSNFVYGAQGKEKSAQAAPAVMAEVERAVRAWRQLGNKNTDHLLLFYFCGHGIARGTDLSLLLSDFGAEPTAPLAGAIDFRRLRQGMDECAAREQCYFVDACRVGSELLIKADGYAGNPIINAIGAVNASGKVRRAPVFYSTLPGTLSYARTGKPSLYTTALIEALSGAGAGDEDGSWRVRTNRLHDALNFLVMDASEELEVQQLQIASSDELTSIDLNEISDPKVPVVFTCNPREAHGEAALSCENAVLQLKRKAAAVPWRLRLPVNSYDFTAKYKAKDYKKNQLIRPAYGRVSLDLK